MAASPLLWRRLGEMFHEAVEVAWGQRPDLARSCDSMGSTCPYCAVQPVQGNTELHGESSLTIQRCLVLLTANICYKVVKGIFRLTG